MSGDDSSNTSSSVSKNRGEYDSEILAEFNRLDGSDVTLVRATSAKEVAQSADALMAVLGITEGSSTAEDFAADRNRLLAMIAKQRLWVWAVQDAHTQEPIGYATVIFFEGPAFVSVVDKKGLKDLELDDISECVDLISSAFFRATDEDALYYYETYPLLNGMNEALIDLGFDPFFDHPGIDNEKEACYVLERYTHDAYQQGDEEEEQEDNSDPFFDSDAYIPGAF